MPESFGARLRQRREQEQIDLTTIAEKTKINLSLLEALERDDMSHWPGGIFRRAFVRDYARAVGLDPDVIVREFLEAHPEPVEEVDVLAAVVAGTENARPNAGPPMRLRYLVGSAIGSLARLRRSLEPREVGPDSWDIDIVPVSEPTVTSIEPEPEAMLEPPAEVMAELQPPAALERSTGEVAAGVMIDRLALASIDALPLTAGGTEPDLSAAAEFCTEVARAYEIGETIALLPKAAEILDATGVIVWLSDPQGAELHPVLAHGYSDRLIAQLPRVRRDADNATAAAFRSAETCVVTGGNGGTGALVVPMITPAGCAGVFAVELQQGREQRDSVRALATIFAAQLATLTASHRLAHAVNA